MLNIAFIGKYKDYTAIFDRVFPQDLSEFLQNCKAQDFHLDAHHTLEDYAKPSFAMVQENHTAVDQLDPIVSQF